MILGRAQGMVFFTTLIMTMIALPSLPGGTQAVRVDRVSNKSFQETVRHLEWGFGGYGITVVLQLDYQRILQSLDVPIRRSLIVEVMRRPWGKTIFENDPAAALDLPLRVYVYEREDGQTVVSYYRPSALFGIYGKEGLDELGRELEGALEAIVRLATK